MRMFPFAIAALPCLALTAQLAACGPKDIGAGTASHAAAQPAGVSVEDQLRYPVTGASRTQRLLYWNNRPDVMANVQQWQTRQWRDALAPHSGVNPEDPAYRAVPKERSPFRQ